MKSWPIFLAIADKVGPYADLSKIAKETRVCLKTGTATYASANYRATVSIPTEVLEYVGPIPEFGKAPTTEAEVGTLLLSAGVVLRVFIDKNHIARACAKVGKIHLADVAMKVASSAMRAQEMRDQLARELWTKYNDLYKKRK